jgi:hypothetical protein
VKAILHGKEPAIPQERPFAETLSCLDFGNERLHVWYTRVLGTRDIDALLLWEGFGFFVIELKSLGLSAIAAIDEDNGIHLRPWVRSSTKKAPWQQALEAAESLQSRFHTSDHYRNTLGPLWVSSSAALFAISREAFRLNFGKEARYQHACEQLAAGMIFAEDLRLGVDLLKRLKYIKANPLYKARPTYNRKEDYSPATAQSIEDFVNWNLQPAEILTNHERERLNQIQQAEEKRLDDVTPEHTIICSGYAGTGKTVLGLQYAIRREIPTLFLCFNKVLGTDVRRLTSMADLFADFAIDCSDFHQLLTDCERRLGLPSLSYRQNFENSAEYEKRRVDRLIERDRERSGRLVKLWPLMIIDEAQDLSDPTWELIDYLSIPPNQLFVIRSNRQMLYREKEGSYLTQLLENTPDSNRIFKRRVYRTTSETFILGQLFLQSFPKLEKAEKLWREGMHRQYLMALKSEDQSELPFEFSRPKGRAPILKPLDLSKPAAVAATVRDAISQAVERLIESQGTPSDLILLVPFADSKRVFWRTLAIKALSDLQLDYCDYTDKDVRRVMHAPNQVRVVTYHSSRGLEGLHSIIFGFEKLVEAARMDDLRASNLGYIALTRSAFETEVFYDQSSDSSVHIDFLKRLFSVTGF